MADIFISYSSVDRELALALVGKLHETGYETWVDIGKISGAMTWSAEIVEAINAASTVIFLVSAHSVASPNCIREVHLAAEKQKNILPVYLESVTLPGSLEYALAGLQWVVFEDHAAILTALEHLKTQKATTPIAPVATDGIRLAVLPFDDLSADHDNGWFADGMMDDLINTLGGFDQLHVNPRNDVLCYREKNPRLEEVARDLHVRYIVSGSVQKVGPKIRIRVTLSDTQLHKHLWSEKYDGTFDDVFDLQDTTVRDITEALELKLTVREQQLLNERETTSPEAYELFLRAKDHFFTRHTRADHQFALQLYQEAMRLDPHFVAAQTEIANIYANIYRHYERTPEILAKLTEAVDKVRELEGETPRWHWIMSYYCVRTGNKDEALRHAELSAQAGYALGYEALGHVHSAMGNLVESVRAREAFVKIREHETTARFNLLIGLNELGEHERLRKAAIDALPIYERHIRFNPEDYHSTVHYLNVLGFAGKNEEAIAQGKDLLQRGVLDGLPSYNLACLFLNLGENDLGMQALEHSVENGFLDLDFFHKDRDLAPVRDTPQFQTLVKKVETKLQEQIT